MWDIDKLVSSDRKHGILAIGSILGPIVLAVTVVVLGFIQPDYSHSLQLMSELGEVGAPNAIFMNVATAILGILILLFAFGLYGIARGTSGKVGSSIMLVGGICMVGGGIFPCDLGCVPVSFIGSLHETVSLIGFSAVIFAPFAISQEFTHSEVWRARGLVEGNVVNL
jgi:hypothetical membrane protein